MKFKIQDIEIDFPYDAYEEQISYMTTLINAIEKRQYAVLESPTGTGKTLSILCATLSWLRKQRSQAMPPSNDNDSQVDYTSYARAALKTRIIYSSRTHSQLSKAMSEIKKTSFRNLRISILGSRDQMCIHPNVSKEQTLSAKNALCSVHMKAKSCVFGNNVEKVKSDITLHEDITDIEEFVSVCKKKTCCPFYVAKELQEHADIVFMPYNYLFDHHIRKNLKISLANSIVILDEAHNVDKIAEETSSLCFDISDIAIAITEITKLMQIHSSDLESGLDLDIFSFNFDLDDLQFVKQKLLNMEKVFMRTDLKNKCFSGSYIFQLFADAEINVDDVQKFVATCNEVSDYISSLPGMTSKIGGILKGIADNLSLVFSIKCTETANNYFKVYVEEKNKNNHMERSINLWCLNPGYGLKKVTNDSLRSIVFTSGTLTPISSFVKEMQLQSPLILECGHIVKDNQFLVIQIDNGPRNQNLRCIYRNRENSEYWHELGLTLQNFFRLIPGGILVFFSGYATLNKAVQSWSSSGILVKLKAIKELLIEPSSKHLLEANIQEYRKHINTGRGAAFLGVCRGKISEGLDFSDEYGRAVIVVGLPYPPLQDPKVVLKKEYIDKHRESPEDMTGEKWYQLEAAKAVNQAIGRVIRHSKDYGAIILCDSQFGNKAITSNLSRWVKSKIIKANNFGHAVRLLSSFFKMNLLEKSQPMVESSKQNASFEETIVKKRTIVCEDIDTKNYNEEEFVYNLRVLEDLVVDVKCSLNDKAERSTLGSCIESLSRAEETPSCASTSQLTQILTNHFPDFMTLKKQPSQSLPSTSRKKDSLLEAKINYMNRLLNIFCISLPKLPDIIRQHSSGNLLAALNTAETVESISKIFPMRTNIDAISSEKCQEIFEKVESIISEIEKVNYTVSHEINKKTDSCMSSQFLESLDSNFKFKAIQGPAKRRKIKIETVKINLNMQCEDKTKERFTEIKDLLVELKSTLEIESYATLTGIVRKKVNTLEELKENLDNLRVLFDEKDSELFPFFKRCKIFFVERWEEEFNKYCASYDIR